MNARVLLTAADGAYITALILPPTIMLPESIVWNRGVFRRNYGEGKEPEFRAIYRQEFSWWAIPEGTE